MPFTSITRFPSFPSKNDGFAFCFLSCSPLKSYLSWANFWIIYRKRVLLLRPALWPDSGVMVDKYPWVSTFPFMKDRCVGFHSIYVPLIEKERFNHSVNQQKIIENHLCTRQTEIQSIQWWIRQEWSWPSLSLTSIERSWPCSKYIITYDHSRRDNRPGCLPLPRRLDRFAFLIITFPWIISMHH